MNENIPDSPYAAWIAWADGFAAGQAPSADSLVPLDDPRLDGYPAQRVLERLSKALNERLEQWTGALVRELSATTRRPGASLGPVLIGARRRMTLIRDELRAAPLTDPVRQEALRATEQLAATAQQELERQLRGPGSAAALAEVRRTPLIARPDGPART